MVENFAIEDECDVTVGARKRLIAQFDVYDAEAACTMERNPE